MALLTSAGYVVTPLDQTVATLTAKLQAIFGPDINLEPNTFDGQMVVMLAESFNNLDQLGQQIVSAFNPNNATGNLLSTLVQLNYITRQPGAYSTVPVLCTGTKGTPIPIGFQCKGNDGSSTIWQNTAAAIIDDSGTITIQCQATTYGALAAPAGTLVTPVTGVFGLASIDNAISATLGNLEEKDEQLRARRAVSTSTNAVGFVDAIRGALLNTPGVTQAQVYENDLTTPNDNGQPANSIYAVVVGGANQDIWNTLWFKKPGAIPLVGATQGTVVDSAGWPHTMSFDRPASTAIYMIIDVKQRQGFPANGVALIQAALVAWGQTNQNIGSPVIQSELYAPTMAAIFNSGSILAFYIGTAANPNTTTDITTAYNAIANFDASRITVNLS